MYNHTGLQGRLTADPELRHTPSGVAITSFRLASDTGRKTKDGQKITNFIDCVAWRAQAEFVSKYLSKGRLVLVEGEITSRNYDDKDGNHRKATEITVDSVHFCDSKKARAAVATSQTPAATRTARETSPRWTTMAGICPSKRPPDNRRPTKTKPKKRDRIEGGDDRGMAASASDAQRPPQAL